TIFIYNWRYAHVKKDLLYKEWLRRFLGEKVSKMVFENMIPLAPEEAYGHILILDIRGYTRFLQINDEQTTSLFMTDFYKAITHLASKYGGHVHKSLGDGFLISFSIMDHTAIDDQQQRRKILACHRLMTRAVD